MGKHDCIQKKEDNGQTASESDQGCPASELQHPDLKSAAYIDAMVRYVERLFDIRFKNVKKNRCNAVCPFHAEAGESFMVYVDKNDEVRFHCFGACKGDWDIYDIIMLRNKCRIPRARRIWADHLGVGDFKNDDGGSSCIPKPDETPEPDDTVCFVEPKKIDEKMAAALNDAAKFYNSGRAARWCYLQQS